MAEPPIRLRLRELRIFVFAETDIPSRIPEWWGQCRRLLAPGGRIVVRTPVLDSWLAETLGAAWIQHDAPLHVVLHTRGSLRRSADAVGLRITDLRDDSTTRLTGLAPGQVTRLNRAQRGDSVCLVLSAE